jgi:hypothetical protein
METEFAGQRAIIDITQISINEPPAESIFELPRDVQALRDKNKAEVDKADTDPDQRPALNKHP